jgi:glycosyltransferase involved in cell wall biosynthesis
LVSLGLACIAGSHCLIAWFVKLHYANLMAYFPLFFLSLVLLGNHLYWPILKKIDLFVRPTLSDNFGISIAEALHFGKKAIASDVCSMVINYCRFPT